MSVYICPSVCPCTCLTVAQQGKIICQANLSLVDTRSINEQIFFSPPPLSLFPSILMVERHPSNKT